MSTEKIDCNSSAVHCYLNTLQGIINRMSGNSAQCKTWCITLVSCILVLSYSKDLIDSITKPTDIINMAFLPLILFYFLDAFYLSVERCYIDKYNKFTESLIKEQECQEKLFDASIGKGFFKRLFFTLLAAVNSPSTIPFYGLLVILLCFAKNSR